jgi:rhodanese-related sulfurtransferase
MRNPITKQQIEAIQEKGGMVRMIDIRSPQEYEKLHVPDVTNIPVEELQNQSDSFSKEDTIVCICNHGKERSQKAAEELYNAGFINTYYLEAGTAGWFE